jgi:starch phosphorylase
MRQEILLGMGGIRALKALGIRPTVFHMNEGHSAFAQLERVRTLVKEKGLTFEAALEVVKSSGVFTTHTPVPAGNDYFDSQVMEHYFKNYAKDIGVPLFQILGLGRQNPQDASEPFCMTILALRLSNFKNGVSQLHREISRQMWQGIWPAFPKHDLPIVHVTNGVHVPSYISKEMSDLYNRYLGPRWIEDPDNQKVWEGVDRIPDTELWRTHERRRERLIAFARRRLKEQLIRRGAMPSEIKGAEDVLDPEALTIGFSRRFATYKRGDLLFKDPDRLAKILNHSQRPVQILFAGKAHPQDMEGKRLIKNIVHSARKEEFRYRIVFLEDYDIVVARYMVQGADVWLNTPRRPMEACGTSGMKAVANGAIHMSILDGWWVEGYGLDRGWAIGAGEHYDDQAYQDDVESRALYDLLEKEVVPLFYERGRDGTPKKWIAMMKSSMRALGPIFNTHRMLEDYMEKFYIPAFEIFKEIEKNTMREAENFAVWKKRVTEGWKDLQIKELHMDAKGKSVVPLGAEYPIKARIFLGKLRPEDVQVELYYGILNPNGELIETIREPMIRERDTLIEDGFMYHGIIPCNKSGRLGFNIRIIPRHPFLVHPCDMGLVIWG